jgi:hypothetical protein
MSSVYKNKLGASLTNTSRKVIQFDRILGKFWTISKFCWLKMNPNLTKQWNYSQAGTIKKS